MTQNECISNIRSPGSAAPPPGHSVFGPCPILNGSDGTVKHQYSLVNCTATDDSGCMDMLNIDEQYDAAASRFIRRAHAATTPFFFYFCSHHTHVPQFAGHGMEGYSPRGLMGDSLSMLDRSVGRLIPVGSRSPIGKISLRAA
jgi:hypothetical protein